jgi:hypothetical protein
VIGLVVNTEKTKYSVNVLSPKYRQSHNLKIADKYFANVTKFKYLGTMLIIIRS